ncbi:hypothetical protein HYV74_01595 [Candidatus Uhrbacteria bacterium]|nr:hypothetical protein [Candidatus Uhrbacteria bacterium]
MADQQQELIEFLQGHFTKIDQQFTKIDQQLVEVTKNLGDRIDATNLRIDAVGDRIGVMNDRIDATNTRIDDLAAGVDGFVTLHKTLDIELVALRDKCQRLEKEQNDLVRRVTRLEGARV